MPSYYRDPSAPAPNTPRKIGVTAIIERDGKLLVERRADSLVDEWAFIGGSLEDERVLAALHREVLEETGFEIEDATFFGVFSDPTRIVAYPDGNVCRVTSLVFRVTARGSADPVPSAESAGMTFVSRAELGRLTFWPAQRPIRDALLNGASAPVVE